MTNDFKANLAGLEIKKFAICITVWNSAEVENDHYYPSKTEQYIGDE